MPGRPSHLETRYKHELTPRQAQILALVDAGRTNYEIAQALGLTLDGVKYHLREIFNRLGVDSREEAAEWWRSQHSLRARAGRAFAAITSAGLAARVLAGAAVAATLVAGMIAVAIMVTEGQGEREPPASGATRPPATSTTATAAAATTPTPTGEPEILLGLQVRPLVVADPLPLPTGIALYVESGCWGCDQPAAAVQRVYRDPAGAVRTEDLFRLAGASVGAPEVDGRYVTSIALARGGMSILLAVCEGPYCGGVGEIVDGAKVSIHHSGDGGITWKKELTIDGGAQVIANFGGGPPGAGGFGLLRRVYRPAAGQPFRAEVVPYPSLDPAPIYLRGQDPATARIFASADGPPLLLERDGVSLYDVSGIQSNPPRVAFPSLPSGSVVVDFHFGPELDLVSWTLAGALYTGLAKDGGEIVEIFRWPAGAWPFFHRPQGGLAGQRTWVVAIDAGRGQVPAVVDLEAALIWPIEELRARGEAGDRMLIKAVGIGPYARVTGAGEGDCLNVRESPSLSAPSFACYPDGVLLKELGEFTSAEGHQWAHVFTPAERNGWASGTYLVRSGEAGSLNYHPAGTRTGNPDVDPIIALLETTNLVPQELIEWQLVECESPSPPVVDPPPGCPEGVASGTQVEVISGAACHGYWRRKPADGSAVALGVGPASRLYAVLRLAIGQWWPPGARYSLIYVDPARPEWALRVELGGGGGVVGDSGGCAVSPIELMRWIAEAGGSVVLAPRSP